MKNRDRLIVGTVGAVLLAIAIFVFYLENRQPVGNSPIEQQITLAENQVPLSTLTIIAVHNGYFARHGLRVVVKSFPSGKLALDAVLGGGADVATVAETPLAIANLSGIPIAVIANIASSSDDVKIAYRKDHGITQPSDLKGKTIATAIGTSAEYFTDQFLAKYGLAVSDVKIINLSPAEMVQALKSGGIDAFAIFEPYPHTAEALAGGEVGIFDSPGLYQETFNIAVRPDFLHDNAAALKEFILALIDAENYVSASSSAAINIVASDTGLDPATLSAIWSQFTFRVMTPDSIADIVTKEQAWVRSSNAGQFTKPNPVGEMLQPSIFSSALH